MHVRKRERQVVRRRRGMSDVDVADDVMVGGVDVTVAITGVDVVPTGVRSVS